MRRKMAKARLEFQYFLDFSKTDLANQTVSLYDITKKYPRKGTFKNDMAPRVVAPND